MAAIHICITEVTSFYMDESTAFSQDIFWDFKALVQVKHDAIPMSWVQRAFDLNSDVAEVLHFTPVGFSIPASYRQEGAEEEGVPVTREVHVCIVDSVKELCKGIELHLYFFHLVPMSWWRMHESNYFAVCGKCG